MALQVNTSAEEAYRAFDVTGCAARLLHAQVPDLSECRLEKRCTYCPKTLVAT